MTTERNSNSISEIRSLRSPEERARILELRDASARARCAALWYATMAGKGLVDVGKHFGHAYGACEDCRKVAASRYPLPKITRPRVVLDPHNHEPQWGKPREWMCSGGVLYSRTIGCRGATEFEFPWTTGAQVPPTAKRVEMWAALLASPTETVEDDGSASSQGEE